MPYTNQATANRKITKKEKRKIRRENKKKK